MRRYRCFCMTEDDKIITGAFIEAEYTWEALKAADQRWKGCAGFHHVEIWLGKYRLYRGRSGEAVQQSLDG